MGRTVALEPDPKRYEEAAKLVEERSVKNAETHNCDLGEYLRRCPTAKFDVVLCSHIFQHFTHNTLSGILLDLQKCTAPDAAFVFTTTYIYGDENLYSFEYFEKGQRRLNVTDLTGFEEAMGREGVLPVCRFAKPWLTCLLEKHGLAVQNFSAYHFLGEHDGARDRENNACDKKLRDARDAAYFCTRLPKDEEGQEAKKSSLSAAGKICFMQFFPLDGRSAGRADVPAQTDDPAAERIRQEFADCENFLYGGNLHFPADRRYTADLSLRLKDIPITESHAVISVYREFPVCQVSVCLTVGETDPANFVYLHQVQCNPTPLFDAAGEKTSIPALCQRLLAEHGLVSAAASDTAIIVELNKLGDRSDAEDLTDSECRCLYGMLTGDEGWAHVPISLARERAASGWSSRDFAQAIVFSTNYILLNFNRADVHTDYISRQYAFACKYYGALDRYFTMDAKTAGVNHGLYFSVETGMLINVTANQLLKQRPDLTSAHGLFLRNEIKKNKKYRGMMIKMLNRVEAVNISELGELDHLIVENLRVTQRVESIRYLLELLESDLSLLYDTNTNRMVNMLTILGLVLACVQVILGLLPFLF